MKLGGADRYPDAGECPRCHCCGDHIHNRCGCTAGSKPGKKNTEKIEEYLPLVNEIKTMWHQQRVEVLPIIFGATGEILQKQYRGLNILRLRRELYLQFQKAVLLSTLRVVCYMLGDDTDPTGT